MTHRNVVRIHDLGEMDGIKYITMTFVEGEDLSTVLKHEGTLPVPRVLRSPGRWRRACRPPTKRASSIAT